MVVWKPVPLPTASLNTDTVYLELQMCLRDWGGLAERTGPWKAGSEDIQQVSGKFKPDHSREHPASSLASIHILQGEAAAEVQTS